MDKRPISILHIIVGLDIGGAELVLQRLVNAHRNNSDYRHIVISLTGIGAMGRQLQSTGVDVYTMGIQSPLQFFNIFWKLVSIIRNIEPNIIQTWMYHGDFLGGLAARVAKNKNVVWGVRATETTGNGKLQIALIKRASAWLSYLVPHTIVCAAEAAKLAHIKIGYDGKRMVVIPNGFDLTKLVSTPADRDNLMVELGISRDTVVFGFIGRFHNDKDQANFIGAAAIVASKAPDARFLLVGRNLDSKNAELTKWLDATGFQDRFHLLGERTDVPVCLAAMNIFCLSSRTEGFPNVVGEAMAMSLPCVVTDVGDAAMLVADTGVVVPKEDASALANGMLQLLEMSPIERKNMGRRARARIEAEFTMDRTRERFEALYQQVIGSPRNWCEE